MSAAMAQGAFDLVGLERFVVIAFTEPLRSALQPLILKAMTMADEFTDSDLDEAYVGPRSRQREDPKKRSG